MSNISDATERMVQRAVMKLKTDAKVFNRYEQELYNIIMNNATGYFIASVEAQAEMDQEEKDYEIAFSNKVEAIHADLHVVLELLKLNSTQKQLSDELNEIKTRQGGSFKVEFNHHSDCFDCEGRDRLIRTLDSISNFFFSESKEDERDEIHDMASPEKQKRLKELLMGTAHWVSEESKKLNRVPEKEAHVQSAMRTILQANFSNDYISKLEIPSYVRNFKPDGGVQSIRTAIEYKFIDSLEELGKAVGGIFEDIVGYGKSREWEFFYSVFYMTKSFADPVALEKSLAEKGNGKWHPIVLVGEGGRKSKTASEKRRKSIKARKRIKK